MNKTTLSLGLLLSTAMLSACHHNPLETHKEQQSTRFLINASMEAAKVLKPNMDGREAQYVYLNCMNGKEPDMDCTALYKAMADFAKRGSFSDFKGVSVADLTDRAVFESLREGYEERLFYNDLGD